MCLPNENFTELLEFCYIYPRIMVPKDLCLYLAKRVSRVNSYNCRKFTHGCPELNYFSSETYVHPSCMEIENGCFSAEPSCKRVSIFVDEVKITVSRIGRILPTIQASVITSSKYSSASASESTCGTNSCAKCFFEQSLKTTIPPERL
eukprot:XP_019921102.1 PREDICTED: uncharacterized protein LOC105324350 [Crassostrea gigas]